MNTFILVMILVGSNGLGGEQRPAIASVEFGSMERCQAALKQFSGNPVHTKFAFCALK